MNNAVEMISKEDARTAVEAFISASGGFKSGEDMRNLEFPLSRLCKVRVIFSSEPTLGEWESFLAHIAFYKSWYSKNDKKPATKDEIVNAVMEALEKNRRGMEGTA